MNLAIQKIICGVRFCIKLPSIKNGVYILLFLSYATPACAKDNIRGCMKLCEIYAIKSGRKILKSQEGDQYILVNGPFATTNFNAGLPDFSVVSF